MKLSRENIAPGFLTRKISLNARIPVLFSCSVQKVKADPNPAQELNPGPVSKYAKEMFEARNGLIEKCVQTSNFVKFDSKGEKLDEVASICEILRSAFEELIVLSLFLRGLIGFESFGYVTIKLRTNSMKFMWA